ncbi:MAG: hypothetical protein ACLPKB_06400 [Xanthobacteraceae bacterium]
MRKFLIGLAAASFVGAVSVAGASAQVTGIRHADGSWTYVDKNGRDIHADYYARGMAEYNARHGYQDDWNEHAYAPRRHRAHHKAGSPQ